MAHKWLLLLASSCAAFTAPRRHATLHRHAALHRLGATSTTTTEMFDSAKAILQREATLTIGNVRFTRVLEDADDDCERAVSYTHLTLPTKA